MTEKTTNRAARRRRGDRPANAEVQPAVDSQGAGWKEGVQAASEVKVEKNKKLTVRVTDEVFRDFKVALATRDESVQAVLERAVIDYLDQDDK